MIKYLFGADWVVEGQTSNGDLEVESYACKDMVSPDGFGYDRQILEAWAPSKFDTEGVKVVVDGGYDTARYELTGTPTYTQEEDDTYTKDYTGTLTEKAGYIETLRSTRLQECNASFLQEISSGYDFDDGTLAVTVECDFDSKLSFKESQVLTRIKDINGVIVTANVTEARVQALTTEISDYYTAKKNKKYEHEGAIAAADRAALDTMTTFDWAI